MKRGTLVAEIYYNDKDSHHTDISIVCDAKGVNIHECLTKDECIKFVLNRFGENIIFVERFRYNILIIHQEL